MNKNMCAIVIISSLTMACQQQANPKDANQNNPSFTQEELVNTGETATLHDYAAPALLDKTIPELSDALTSGETTSVELVNAYLARIEKLDRDGPQLNSIISLNPDALTTAARLDDEREKGQTKGPLHGIPILLKDNIDTTDKMPTTAGALALKDNYKDQDSPLVTGLRNAGAIILGKTNLSQWANFRSENSMSGWSLLGGQVRNPHILNRNPCGSSSGSGAATAASLGAGAVGTETNGSIICPANANGIVGFKPTVGIISQQGIVPISATQDTAGPMTKSVEGAALMMNAMASNTTDIDFTSELSRDSLSGVRIGVLRFAEGEYTPIKVLFEQALEDLEYLGAELVFIDQSPTMPDAFWRMSYDILKYEFKAYVSEYLATTDAEEVSTRTLTDLIEFNRANASTELALFDQSIFESSVKMGSLDDEQYIEAVSTVKQATQIDGIDKLLKENTVDALVAPSGVLASSIDVVNGDVWPNSWPGYGGAAAKAGYPHASVPMGKFRNLPVGISFIGTAYNDAKIMGYAYAYEQQSRKLSGPKYLPSAVADEEIATLMKPLMNQTQK